MNIGVIIGRIGGTDGVAQETEKWIRVLRSMGHRIHTIAGQYQDRSPDPQTETIYPELSFSSPESFRSQKRAFFYPETNAHELIEEIRHYATVISDRIIQWIDHNALELIISENASSLPSHLEMGYAIRQVLRKTGIPVITHDHDFAWDRGDRYRSPQPRINEFIEEVFPLRSDRVVHAVINSNAATLLKERYGCEAEVVPNVMDFSKPFGTQTPASSLFSEKLGYTGEDIVLLQATRILRRKGIDTAIRLVHELQDPHIKLLVTGNYPDDAGSVYYQELTDLIHELGLQNQVRFAHPMFHPQAPPVSGNAGKVPLSDAYACATGCTYFSRHEGFGNEFVEAILARRPVFVNNYEPVFMPEIGSKGFKTVMIEHGDLTGEAVNEINAILHDPVLAHEMAEFNFELGKRYFSFETLHAKLQTLISRATGKVP
ncbi:MAG: glycosyltransferase family 4 protein [Bacteroidales bacterium]